MNIIYDDTILYDNLGYRTLQRITNQSSGIRTYTPPDGQHSYPSVTTILAHNKSDEKKKILHEWKQRVGAVRAAQITKFACDRGTFIHELIENKIKKTCGDVSISSPTNNKSWVGMAEEIYNSICCHCTHVHGVEVPLYSDKYKMAGTVDCIGVWDGVLSIIDFKTSSKPKRKEWISDYFLQETAYAVMLYERTGMMAKKIITIMVDDITHDMGMPPTIFVQHPFRDGWAARLIDILSKNILY